MKDKVIAYLQEHYPEEVITQKIDDEITSGNWVSQDEIDEDDDVEDEFDWYENYGNGEAEDAVAQEIVKEICDFFNIDNDTYEAETGESLSETLKEHSDKFDNLIQDDMEQRGRFEEEE